MENMKRELGRGFRNGFAGYKRLHLTGVPNSNIQAILRRHRNRWPEYDPYGNNTVNLAVENLNRNLKQLKLRRAILEKRMTANVNNLARLLKTTKIKPPPPKKKRTASVMSKRIMAVRARKYRKYSLGH